LADDVIRSATALACLACGWVLAPISYADSPAPLTQLSVTVVAGGKTTAQIVLVLPHGSEMKMQAENVIPTPGNDDVYRLVGDASVSTTLNGADLGSVHGDELIVSKEVLDAGRVVAKAELSAMFAADQSIRAKLAEQSRKSMVTGDAPEFAAQRKEQEALDRRNQDQLDRIVKQYGWPTVKWAGREGAEGAFFVVQHADLDYQKKYLSVVQEAVAQDNLSPSLLAMLEDRIRVKEGKKQIYGTQLNTAADGTSVLFPIEDEANVDARRASVGLGPLAEYLKSFGPKAMPQSHKRTASNRKTLACKPWSNASTPSPRPRGEGWGEGCVIEQRRSGNERFPA
jgi:hypothetical protein